MSHCQWKKLISHSVLSYIQPEILTNVFGAFNNEHPVWFTGHFLWQTFTMILVFLFLWMNNTFNPGLSISMAIIILEDNNFNINCVVGVDGPADDFQNQLNHQDRRQNVLKNSNKIRSSDKSPKCEMCWSVWEIWVFL